MKFFTTSLALILFGLYGFSQNKTKQSKHYLLTEFSDGSILLKDGTTQTAILNYNVLSENFAIKKEDEIFGLSKSVTSTLDTVYVANRKFFIREGNFYEFLLKSDVELYVEYTCNLSTNTEGRAGYGSTSQTSSTSTVDIYQNGGNIYALELPERYNVTLDIEYWIKKDNILTKITTVNQFKKVYKDYKKEIKIYRKKNKVEFKAPLTVLKFIEHLEGLID